MNKNRIYNNAIDDVLIFLQRRIDNAQRFAGYKGILKDLILEINALKKREVGVEDEINQ